MPAPDGPSQKPMTDRKKKKPCSEAQRPAQVRPCSLAGGCGMKTRRPRRWRGAWFCGGGTAPEALACAAPRPSLFSGDRSTNLAIRGGLPDPTSPSPAWTPGLSRTETWAWRVARGEGLTSLTCGCHAISPPLGRLCADLGTCYGSGHLNLSWAPETLRRLHGIRLDLGFHERDAAGQGGQSGPPPPRRAEMRVAARLCGSAACQPRRFPESRDVTRQDVATVLGPGKPPNDKR